MIPRAEDDAFYTPQSQHYLTYHAEYEIIPNIINFANVYRGSRYYNKYTKILSAFAIKFHDNRDSVDYQKDTTDIKADVVEMTPTFAALPRESWMKLLRMIDDVPSPTEPDEIDLETIGDFELVYVHVPKSDWYEGTIPEHSANVLLCTHAKGRVVMGKAIPRRGGVPMLSNLLKPPTDKKEMTQALDPTSPNVGKRRIEPGTAHLHRSLALDGESLAFGEDGCKRAFIEYNGRQKASTDLSSIQYKKAEHAIYEEGKATNRMDIAFSSLFPQKPWVDSPTAALGKNANTIIVLGGLIGNIGRPG